MMHEVSGEKVIETLDGVGKIGLEQNLNPFELYTTLRLASYMIKETFNIKDTSGFESQLKVLATIYMVNSQGGFV